jgi:hypothetical protein
LQNYTKYVGEKKTFRLLNRGSAKALDKVAELDGKKLYVDETKMIAEKSEPEMIALHIRYWKRGLDHQDHNS